MREVGLNSSDTFVRDAERSLAPFTGRQPVEPPPLVAPTPDRRWRTPLILLILTALSTTWVGMTAWDPLVYIQYVFSGGTGLLLRQSIIANWKMGLLFSGALLAILSAHEMGHYVVSRIYKVRASLPIFIPFPFNPIGTMGAVILMDGRTADRRQIFDIGLAGPIAGLVVAIPIAVLGLYMPTTPEFALPNPMRLGTPLAIHMLDWLLGSGVFTGVSDFSPSASSPLLMAAWIGLLITGINMMPMSQLDGGHVAFGLLGRRSVYLSTVAFTLAAAYIVWSGQYTFMLMLILVFVMRLRHPPSRNDNIWIGWPRAVMAVLSLTLPILCIPAQVLTINV